MLIMVGKGVKREFSDVICYQAGTYNKHMINYDQKRNKFVIY